MNVNPLGGFNQGQYTLITSTAAISDSANYSVVPGGAIAGFPTSNFSVTNDGTHLLLNVNVSGNPSLVWTGAMERVGHDDQQLDQSWRIHNPCERAVRRYQYQRQ